MAYQSEKLPNKPTFGHFKKHKDELLGAMGSLETRLLQQPFLCGQRMSIGDIIVFNEITMFLEICDLKITDDELKVYP
jgi:glutathione S-transferase